ncbi:TlpA disulfide reductase family protein [Saccharicrinis sp. FJH62]|uniref:TlpA disulfide reductase family protein n=1 Tax=Saccharicrinis sp. FJH62 TaxID=3344657 RepID=UPI0035D3EA6B
MGKLLIVLFLFLFTAQIRAQNVDIEMKSTDNKWVNLQDQLGEKLTIIDFWATWCKPCLNAMPKINSIYESYKNKGVNVIGISVDSPRNHSKVKPLLSSLKITYPVLFDMDEDLKNELNVSVMPTLCILNSEGKLIYMHEGFTPGDEEKIKEEIEKHL